MKIIYFNINKGKDDLEGVIRFLQENSEVGVFCLQEVSHRIKDQISSSLENYNNKYYAKEIENFGYFNLGVYVKKNFQNVKFQIIEENNLITAPAIYLELESGNSKYHILNFHGTYLPANKLDTDVRIKASQNLIEFFKEKEGIKIIGGDFNLLPNTESIKIFEQEGYTNLIKDFNIQTTRNENAWKLYPNNKQLYADYVFINEAEKVLDFKTINNLISDHLPLILTCNLQ